MPILNVRTLLALCLAAGLPSLAAASPAASSPPADSQAAGSPALTPPSPVDAPLHLPLLAWEDGIGVASAPWRASSEDWEHVALGAAAVLGTALLLDRPIQKALQRHDSPSLHRWADHLAPIGNTYSFLFAGGLYAAGYLGKDGDLQAAGADTLSSLLVATAVLVPLKYGFGRATPADNLGDSSFKPFSSRDSFPSGHTTWAFAAASAFTEHYSEPWIQVTAYGLATVVGLARLEQNQHWASDVLAGALVGTTVGKLVPHLNQRKRFGQQGRFKFSMEPELGLGYQGVRMALVF